MKIDTVPCLVEIEKTLQSIKEELNTPELQPYTCTYEKIDPRFTPSGLYGSQNNVTFKSWNRSTLNWSLSCEQNGYSRADGSEAVQTILDSRTKPGNFLVLGIASCALFSLSCCFIVYPQVTWAFSRLGILIFAVLAIDATFESLDDNSIS